MAPEGRDLVRAARRFMFAAFLFCASATALDVGDAVDLFVPDISYFSDPPEARQFTCRAVTEHAYWLVQDTTYFDLPASSPGYQVLWDSLMTQEELDSIAEQFEGAGVDVHGTITSLFGPMPVTANGDDRIWIAFSDVPDYFPNPQGPPSRLQSWVYVWPADFDGDPATGNDHDVFYVNLGVYKNQPGAVWAGIRGSVHTWAVATGLGELIRTACNPGEERWVVRGLGVFGQFLCYGITSALSGQLAIEGYLDAFATAGGIELTSWCSGQKASDFAENLGGELLWFMYLEQRTDPGIFAAIVQSDETGMQGIASGIDPSVPDSVAVEVNVYPLYEDWLITNLVAHVAGDFEGGRYRYDALEEAGYLFTIMDSPASFLGEFAVYPFPTWIAPVGYGLSAQVFAAQYASFTGAYSGHPTVHFDGMYNQNDGSGPDLDGNWIAYRVVLADDSTLLSVDSLELDGLFNGTFELGGDRTFLVLTNGNPGGTAQLRYTLSQDTGPKAMFLLALQNSMDQRYLQVFTSLVREGTGSPYGFDWVGPDLEISLLDDGGESDSTATVPMEQLSGTLWTGRAYAWDAGTYRLCCTGYDSLGLPHADSLLLAVGFGGGGDLTLDIGEAGLVVRDADLATDAMACLADADAGGSPIFPGIPVLWTGGTMTGIVAGPVMVSPVPGTLSFPSADPDAGIFRWDGDRWERIDSRLTSGRILASVSLGGIYALGEGPGVTSPEVPAEFSLLGTFPNPFSSATTIDFSVPAAGHTVLRVYDMTGRLLRSVEQEIQSPGRASVVWDGRDTEGSPVPPGIYLLMVDAPGGSIARRVARVG